MGIDYYIKETSLIITFQEKETNEEWSVTRDICTERVSAFEFEFPYEIEDDENNRYAWETKNEIFRLGHWEYLSCEREYKKKVKIILKQVNGQLINVKCITLRTYYWLAD